MGRKLQEIAADLKAVLTPVFRSVRVTSVQTSDQFLTEIAAIGREKLPGVIIVFDRYDMTGGGTVREDRFTLVLVDRFVAGSDDRALSVLTASETLLELFPKSGRTINGVFYTPVDCSAASPSNDYACLALGLMARHG